MSNEQLLFNTSLFFASERWWHPIISFVYSNNEPFKSEQINTTQNSKKICFSHEQYAKFIEFSNMIVKMIDKDLCASLGVSNQMLENVLFSTYEDGNIQSRVIIDTLQKAMSFNDFRNEMFRCSSRTEEMINESIIELTSSISEEMDLSNSETLAKKVTEATQNKIDHEINDLIEKGCRQMRALLSIDITRPIIPGSPQRRPLPNLQSPQRKGINSDTKSTTINDYTHKQQGSSITSIRNEINPNSTNIEKSNDHQLNSHVQLQTLSTPKRNINRPLLLKSKVPFTKLSLKSSSSSNSDSTDEDSYSYDTTSPSSKQSSKSAPQSPISISKSRFPSNSQIKTPSTANSTTTSPIRASKHSTELNDSDDKRKADLEEIERRRQFYIKQRDILSKQEHRKPPLHPVVKVQKPFHRPATNNSPASKQRKYYRKIDE